MAQIETKNFSKTVKLENVIVSHSLLGQLYGPNCDSVTLSHSLQGQLYGPEYTSKSRMTARKMAFFQRSWRDRAIGLIYSGSPIHSYFTPKPTYFRYKDMNTTSRAKYPTHSTFNAGMLFTGQQQWFCFSRLGHPEHPLFSLSINILFLIKITRKYVMLFVNRSTGHSSEWVVKTKWKYWLENSILRRHNKSTQSFLCCLRTRRPRWAEVRPNDL